MDYRQPIEPVILALVVIGLFGLPPETPSASFDEDALLPDFVSDEEHELVVVPVAAMALSPIS
jgi:hypothetical protein